MSISKVKIQIKSKQQKSAVKPLSYMNQQSNSPIDLEQLNRISEGDIEFEIEILQVYVEDTLPRIAEIRKAIANSDRAQLLQETHHIKGASSNVGAIQILVLVNKIEQLDQDSETALALVTDMLEEMQAVELFVTEKSSIFESSKL